jgi:hypothetical protein
MGNKDTLPDQMKLSHVNQQAWFARVRILLKSRKLLDALSDDRDADKSAEALNVITCNISDAQLHLIDPATSTAKSVWEELVKEFAGKSSMRQAALLQQLATLRPQAEQLDSFITRVLSLRQQMETAGCLYDAVLSCLFLTGLRDTDLLGAWAVQQLQEDPVPVLPTLAQNLRTTFLPNLEDTIDAPLPSANRVDTRSNKRPTDQKRSCRYCNQPGHSILSCWSLRDDIREFDKKRGERKQQPNQGARRGNGGKGGHFHSHHISAFQACSSSPVVGKQLVSVCSHPDDLPAEAEVVDADPEITAFQTVALNVVCSKNDRLFDSGASNHMVNDASKLVNVRKMRGVNTHPLLHVRSSRGLLGTLLGVL